MHSEASIDTVSLFRSTLAECRELYLSSGRLCASQYPQLIEQSGSEFVQLMDDLHRGLLLKIYITVCEADRQWSEGERRLGEVLFEHLWGKHLTGDRLGIAAREAAHESEKLAWYSLVRPFDRLPPLRDRRGTLETIIMRLANLIARSDGVLHPNEAAAIQSIHDELESHFGVIPLEHSGRRTTQIPVGTEAIATIQADASGARRATQPSSTETGAGQRVDEAAVAGANRRPPDLHEALSELDELIGLAPIKNEIRTLANYLKLEKRRREAGLSVTDISLHMVFTGNPGTGKTSVARIVGKIFAAMGVLQKGHLVETDRSGLVAGYAGQTAQKANAKIDEALDGILFIDEAYSLVSKQGEDQYGNEALQALLKRAEDDRHRLVVILAGYPDEMRELLEVNPGLSSRFDRVLQFDDYSPMELAHIFGWLCEKNRYKLGEGTRPKLMLGLTELYRTRDCRFGNGRAVRNLFEQTIRRMANRIADIGELTPEQLMRIEADDIEFTCVAASAVQRFGDDGPWRFKLKCPKCTHESKAPGSFLGKKVRCPKCRADFTAEWGEVVDQ